MRDGVAFPTGNSGFPKSQNVSKAIDKAAGAKREVVAQVRAKSGGTEYLNRSNADTHAYRPDGYQKGENVLDITAAATPEARQWNGWGTALKPALEPITVARKPLTGTVAANVQQHGTGALNIDGCRVAYETVDGGSLATNPHLRVHINGGNGGHIIANETKSRQMTPHEQGRWPANLIHDGSDEVVGLFPVTTSGSLTAANQVNGGFSGTKNCYGRAESGGTNEYQANTGSAARFFYCAKASKADRDEGLDHLPKQSGGMVSNTSGQHMTRRDEGYEVAPRANNHPTVKPTDLMRYLCRLVTPPGGTILDPFTGSGSTGKAAMLEGFCFLGIEINGEYLAIANARIQAEVDSRGP